MKTRLTRMFCLLLMAGLLWSCVGGNGSEGGGGVSVRRCSNDSKIKYATGFDITDHNDYREVIVYNPWVKGAVQQRFYLVEESNAETPAGGGIRLKVPVSSIAISSCTHTEFLDMIGCIEQVTGMCSPQLIYNETLYSRYQQGAIASLGDAFSVDFEALLKTNPDVYMVASYNNQNDNTDRIAKAGVNVVYNNEWTETTLLGRAEWLKFMAAFFDKEELADSLFGEIEGAYFDAIELGKQAAALPRVMAGGNFKGTWYVPGGKSWMGQLFTDAGGSYYYSTDSTTTSIPLNFESVLNNFHNADVWVNAPTSTIQELTDMDTRHSLFAPVKTGRVYSFYARVKDRGANDFWESAVAHPDRIIKDMVWALHPELQPDYEPYYIMQLR